MHLGLGAVEHLVAEGPDVHGIGHTLSWLVAPGLRQDPNCCSDDERDEAEHGRCACLGAPALRCCTSPSFPAEREGESTEDDWSAEPKGQHSYKAEDAAD